MVVLDLVKQEWKKGTRAQGFYKNLAVNLLLGFLALYMAALFLFLGFSLDNILESVHDTLNPAELFGGAMFYIVVAGLAFRFFMQQLNTINLPPYQVLPIKRTVLVNFLLVKPLFSIINYFHLFIVIPFAVQSVSGYYGSAVAVRFVLACVIFVWFNSLMAAFLKRKFSSGFLSFVALIVVFAVLIALEYFKIFSFFNISKICFGFIVGNPLGLLIPLAAVVAAYLLNRLFFYQNYYPERFNQKIKSDRNSTADLSFLNRFGMIGEMIAVELKLILRHKRTKSILYMSAFFLLYGLIFYTQPAYQERAGLLFFVAMFVTGLLMFMYGQWVISWDSGHFDSLMTKNIPIRTYLNANYYMLLAFNVICFVLTTPYFFFGTKIIYMHLAAFVFNSGVNIYLLLFLATYNTKRIDLTKASAMNYQGTTFKSFLIVMPIMLLPMFIVGAISTLVSMPVALWTLTILGVAGFLLRKPLITLCVNQFNKRKYKLAEGFRQSE
ncbi:MAG: DUF5687 family protein [Bacteroidales bacterium]|nr:DUF5687 family protein [Bacteroidales bacterium]